MITSEALTFSLHVSSQVLLPPTPDWEFTLCVPEELLQLYAIVLFGVVGIRDMDIIKMTIPLINNIRFIFVIILATIKVNYYVILELYSV